MFQEYQLADLLIVASKRLAYCEVIIDFPNKAGKRNFDNMFPVDQFYKNVCNTCFHDAILIVGSLLDPDKRVISFQNWMGFLAQKKKELDIIIKQFEADGFKEIRDQLIAHMDSGNSANMFPYFRTQGVIDDRLILKLRNITNDLVKEFFDYTQKFSSPYSPDYFDISGAINEIEMAIGGGKPNLTDNYVI